MFFLIGFYGGRNRKIHAAYQFFLYTLFGSLFLFLALIVLYLETGTTDYQVLLTIPISENRQYFLWLSRPFSKGDMTNRLIHSSSSTFNKCQDLVVYMSPYSLGSTLKYPNYTAQLRAMVKIPVHLHSLIVGVLLSDGWLFKNSTGKTLLALKQARFEYLWFVYTR